MSILHFKLSGSFDNLEKGHLRDYKCVHSDLYSHDLRFAFSVAYFCFVRKLLEGQGPDLYFLCSFCGKVSRNMVSDVVQIISRNLVRNLARNNFVCDYSCSQSPSLGRRSPEKLISPLSSHGGIEDLDVAQGIAKRVQDGAPNGKPHYGQHCVGRLETLLHALL